ncbi:MAG: FHA domain-containing protein [Phormidesmis sp.]
MITCPNCNHQNPDGALQCEACYTPLPATIACPSCNTPVQADASFCGQCGYDLRDVAAGGSEAAAPVSEMPDSAAPTQNFMVSGGAGGNSGEAENTPDFELPDLVEPDPLVVPDPVGVEVANESAANEAAEPVTSESAEPVVASTGSAEIVEPPTPAVPSPPVNVTQLQTLTARLRQVQTGSVIEIPRQLSVVRIGKPNDQTPPDIDVAGFPNSEVVSRVHANLRVEGDVYYLEDVGSSNGTYVNGLPLPVGNRHRLRPGDRIAFGKGDKVSFIFETV